MKKPLFLIAAAICAWLALAQAPAQQPAPRFQAVPAPAPARTAQPAKPIPGTQLLAELRNGGYVIYFRHTSTDFSRDDARSQSDDDCANQRPLTDKGRDEARAIGAAIRDLKIPLGKVLASPRCRTMETAMLAFGRAEKTSAVRGGPANPQTPGRYADLRGLLSTQLKPGTNLVIVSHGNPFYAVAGAPQVTRKGDEYW